MRIERILIAGALSNTGQLVARSLQNDYKVNAMCSPSTGSLVKDDSGPLSTTNIVPSGDNLFVDTLVIATDEAPPEPTLRKLLESCSEVKHTVLLSRLGAETGSRYTEKWQELETTATNMCPNLTIVRVGEPLLGGPFHATDPDLVSWKKAQVADLMQSAQVASGDALVQSGFGSSRIVAASAIGSALRRGPQRQVSFAVTSTGEGEVTTSEQMDAMFAKAAGSPATTGVSEDSKPAQVTFDVSDELLQPLTNPFYQGPPMSPLEVLKANFFGNPAVAGPNWLTVVFIVGGLFQCTRPDYIEKMNIDVFGLAPYYGITLDATQKVGF